MCVDDDDFSSFSQPIELVKIPLSNWKFAVMELSWQREFTKDIPHFQYHYLISTMTNNDHYTALYHLCNQNNTNFIIPVPLLIRFKCYILAHDVSVVKFGFEIFRKLATRAYTRKRFFARNFFYRMLFINFIFFLNFFHNLKINSLINVIDRVKNYKIITRS